MLRTFLLSLSLAFGLAACGEVEEFVDCADICGDYEDCLGDDFDRSECIDRCEEQPQNQIDTCDACLDGDGDQCIDCTAACAPLAI